MECKRTFTKHGRLKFQLKAELCSILEKLNQLTAWGNWAIIQTCSVNKDRNLNLKQIWWLEIIACLFSNSSNKGSTGIITEIFRAFIISNKHMLQEHRCKECYMFTVILKRQSNFVHIAWKCCYLSCGEAWAACSKVTDALSLSWWLSHSSFA